MPKTATPRPLSPTERAVEKRKLMDMLGYKAKNDAINKANDKRSPVAKAVGWDENKTQFIRDLLTGGNDVAGRGMIAGMLGAPGDIAGLAENSLRGLIGKPQVQPWGGSEHIGQTLEQAGLVSDVRRPKTELLASLISPGAAAKTVLNAPKTARIMLQGLENLDAPRTMSRWSQKGAIDVWHGSPHKYDVVDSTNNMGKGEGAQAYGHGFYSAGARPVAEQYREALSDGGERFFVDGVEVINRDAKGRSFDVSDPKTAAIFYAAREGDDAARSYFETQGGWGQKAIAELDSLKGKQITSELPGYLYRNQLRWPDAAREASDPLSDKHFLDWDKPLAEQPQAVQDRLRPFLSQFDTVEDGERYAYVDDYDYMDEIYRKLSGKYIGDDVASAELAKQGIPGIRYLDGGSRSAGQGTHNYVTFDDSLVNILERNGQPVTAPRPGLLGRQITRKP